MAIVKNQHVNWDGLLIHKEPRTGERCTHFAHLATDVKTFIADGLRQLMSPLQIMARHLYFLNDVLDSGNEITRDMMITIQDIRNMAKDLAILC